MGSQGRISDGGISKKKKLFKELVTQCKLNLPEYYILPGRKKVVPHVFLGIMPFHPWVQEKGSSKRIFNYRHSRGRRITENVFENLSAVFRIFWKYLLLELETAADAVMGCIYLLTQFYEKYFTFQKCFQKYLTAKIKGRTNFRRRTETVTC